MSDEFVLRAEARNDKGKGASRRLRRLNDLVPAVVYGGNGEPVAISIPHKDMLKATENEAFYSHIISLEINGEAEDVLIKDLQRHPARKRILHADFLRIIRGQKITVNVPLHYINEDKCHGVKMEGGIVLHTFSEIEIVCLPRNLPEYIEVDMLEVKLGQQVHLSDVVLPEGVESVALNQGPEHDLSIASVSAPKGGAEEEEEAADAEAADAEATDAEGADDDADAGDKGEDKDES